MLINQLFNDSMECETEKLVSNDNDSKATVSSELSINRQRLLLFIILLLQFFSLCADTFIYPFFPYVSAKRGLTHTEVGLVFSAYDLPRFITSPIFGSLVGYIICVVLYLDLLARKV